MRNIISIALLSAAIMGAASDTHNNAMIAAAAAVCAGAAVLVGIWESFAGSWID